MPSLRRSHRSKCLYTSGSVVTSCLREQQKGGARSTTHLPTPIEARLRDVVSISKDSVSSRKAAESPTTRGQSDAEG